MSMIAIDRYISLSKPLHYGLIVTKSRALTAIVLGWLFNSALTVLGVATVEIDKLQEEKNCRLITVNGRIMKYTSLPYCGLCILVIICLYSRVACVAHQYQKRKNSIQGSQGITVPASPNQSKITRMMGEVVVLYFILITPAVLYGTFGGRSDNIIGN